MRFLQGLAPPAAIRDTPIPAAPFVDANECQAAPTTAFALQPRVVNGQRVNFSNAMQTAAKMLRAPSAASSRNGREISTLNRSISRLPFDSSQAVLDSRLRSLKPSVGDCLRSFPVSSGLSAESEWQSLQGRARPKILTRVLRGNPGPRHSAPCPSRRRH